MNRTLSVSPLNPLKQHHLDLPVVLHQLLDYLSGGGQKYNDTGQCSPWIFRKRRGRKLVLRTNEWASVSSAGSLNSFFWTSSMCCPSLTSPPFQQCLCLFVGFRFVGQFLFCYFSQFLFCHFVLFFAFWSIFFYPVLIAQQTASRPQLGGTRIFLLQLLISSEFPARKDPPSSKGKFWGGFFWKPGLRHTCPGPLTWISEEGRWKEDSLAIYSTKSTAQFKLPGHTLKFSLLILCFVNCFCEAFAIKMLVLFLTNL